MGVLLALVAVPAGRALADTHRRFAGALLGDRIESGYLPTEGRSTVGLPLVWLRDPARWRDFAHLWFSATGGFVLSALPALLLTAPVVHVTSFIVDPNVGWLVLLLLSGPMLLAWWMVTPHCSAAGRSPTAASSARSRVAELEERVAEVEETRIESLDH